MDLDSFRQEMYWCPRDAKVTDCPGPCPDQQRHARLPWCTGCQGLGKIHAQVKKVPPTPEALAYHQRVGFTGDVTAYQLVGDTCLICDGQRAIPPIFN